MHYAITLNSLEQVQEIRQRVAERGPVFDRLPGLAAKAFLLDEVEPCYSLYYLWSDTDSMQDFLEGPLFGALVEKYGRPEVTLHLTRATAWPFSAGDVIRVGQSQEDCGLGSVTLVDPRLGDIVCLNANRGRQFEVLYLAGTRG